MAVKDSEELKSDERYPLGDYSFRIERTSVPGSTNDKIEAICTKDGKNARKSIQIPSSAQIEGWYVEANEETVDVYATCQVPVGEIEYRSDLDTGDVQQPIPASSAITMSGYNWATHKDVSLTLACQGQRGFAYYHDYGEDRYQGVSMISASTNDLGYKSYTYDGRTVYYTFEGISAPFDPAPTITGGVYMPEGSHIPSDTVAWTLIYGTKIVPVYEVQEILIGRFAIDIEDAGGVGPGSDWTDPEDYDEDWEEGDPTHTLYVEVTGALSGRHNDPIVDPSYSYIPADKDTVKDYGCGGDGGYGGGGGAGASTVVIHKFATNQANSKEVTAIARRHGYGSGGGKGGKGGDGCILVYY